MLNAQCPDQIKADWMNRKPQATGIPERVSDSLPVLALLSFVVGAASGLLGALFRLALERADRIRDWAIGRAHEASWIGLLLVIAACALAAAIAAWLVRRFAPYASGSGIPHVEAVLNEDLPAAQARLIPVKFLGGVLAIGSGLALGREGPSVQMGAAVSHFLGRIFKREGPDRLVLLAAGAGAGLATAFNAPMAGAIFVLEELVRRFDTRITIATFGASAAAIGVARLFLGQKPDFTIEIHPYPGLGDFPLHLALGLLAGFLGVAYNKAILGGLAATDLVRRWPVELRAALIGAFVGVIAWFVPELVGGGETIAQRTLAGPVLLEWTALALLLRFFLGPISYAVRAPGGLFAPLLVVGAQSGLLFGIVCQRWFPEFGPDPRAFAVVGMAAFFTAVVRAPLTGIILVTEMTANYTLLLPMAFACFVAMLLPTLLGCEPIYDSLKERILRDRKTPARAEPQPQEVTEVA
jgi:chloride channel protein, CIC family